MKNKYYIVKDNKNQEGFANIVIASSVTEAKKIGSYIEHTDCLENWIDLKVKAVKGGESFFFIDDEERRHDFSIGGEGFFYTDREIQLDSDWSYFMNDLKYHGRFEVEN